MKQWYWFLVFLGSIILSVGCGNGSTDGGDDDPIPPDPPNEGWVSTQGPFGGRVNDLALDPSLAATEQVFAVGRGNVFYTNTAGDTWEKRKTGLPEGQIQSIATIPFQFSTVLFVGIQNQGIYRSLDNGATWALAMDPNINPANKDYYALAAVTQSHYYVGINDTAENTAQFYSVLGDAPWVAADRTMDPTGWTTPKPKPKKIYSIVQRERNATNHLYVGTDVDVFLTITGGEFWLQDYQWLNFDGQGLYQKLGNKLANVYSLALLQSMIDDDLPFDQDVLYAGIKDTRGVGKPFQLLWRFNETRWVNKLTSDLDDGDTIIAIDGARLATNDRLYVGMLLKGVFFSEDAGAEAPVWQMRNSFANNVFMQAPSTISLKVAIGAGQAGADIVYRASPIYGVLVSADSGATFSIQDTNFIGTVVNGLIVDATNPQRVLAATDSGIFVKTANVDQWTRKATSVVSNFAQYVGIVGNADLSSVFTANWTGVYSLSHAGDLVLDSQTDFDNAMINTIGGNGTQVWVGTDAGTVWTRIAANDWRKLQSPEGDAVYSLAYAAGAGDDGTLYAGTNKNIYRHPKPQDEAEAWKEDILLKQDNVVTQIAVNNDGTFLLAAVLNEGVYYRDPEDGWVLRALELTEKAKIIYGIAFVEKEVYIGTEDGIWYISDITSDTAKWETRNFNLANKNVWSLVLYPGDKNILYAGTAGSGVYFTESAGKE